MNKKLLYFLKHPLAEEFSSTGVEMNLVWAQGSIGDIDDIEVGVFSLKLKHGSCHLWHTLLAVL